MYESRPSSFPASFPFFLLHLGPPLLPPRPTSPPPSAHPPYRDSKVTHRCWCQIPPSISPHSTTSFFLYYSPACFGLTSMLHRTSTGGCYPLTIDTLHALCKPSLIVLLNIPACSFSFHRVHCKRCAAVWNLWIDRDTDCGPLLEADWERDRRGREGERESGSGWGSERLSETEEKEEMRGGEHVHEWRRE